MYLLQLESEERKLFIELAHTIANSDGVLLEEEVEMLERYRDEMNLSHLEFELQNLGLAEILEGFKNKSSVVKRIAFLEPLAIALLMVCTMTRKRKLRER